MSNLDRQPPPSRSTALRAAEPSEVRITATESVGAGRPPFPKAARDALADTQLRHNIGHATKAIRTKRGRAVSELPDWQLLREAGRALKERVLRHLDTYLLELEAAVQRAGGVVHWARDGEECNRIVIELVSAHGAQEVVKSKSLTTEETMLNEALAHHGIRAIETDLAQLIIQLSDDTPSHILVPAIHRNRAEIRELFLRSLDEAPAELSDDPRQLAETARRHLRKRFLEAKVGISGVNFAVADTGTVSVVESEGNGRMCTTLPEVLISVMGIEKLVPTWQDLEVFMQLLPRSSTAERMNPYTSLWSGVTPGDGPQEFHLVLLDNGRTNVLADTIGRQALNCIRCSACLNICPVYERTGGHAYGSAYPGPIGAILTPMLSELEMAGSLPYASSLCGACYEVCPVKINIPEVLVHLRHKRVQRGAQSSSEKLAMDAVARVFADRRLYEAAQRSGRLAQLPLVHRGKIGRLPGPLAGWTAARDLQPLPKQSFRDWWRQRS
ncbi:MAG: iron-sulfur cluster-binding protein [Solirubrobacterales bacterium]|nr:iron-sulfur cluster-binding protein [Solirubrobacterales bacterium]